ncbi:MAG TPA: GNAT family N-acetyltransferase [Blastocatellia bacterium]|jgi:RimJ/RimL family protein N-acetyltransferase
MELKLSRSTIRNWRRGDEESVVRHANNRKIWRNLRDMFPYPYTLKDANQWIEKETSRASSTNYAIDVGGEAVGAIGLILYDDVFRRSAEIGYWLGEEYWGKGIVTEAVQALTDYAFSNFDLRRVYAGVFEWNPGSMRVLEKAGYQLEARLHKHVTKDGETIDQFIYAVVRP